MALTSTIVAALMALGIIFIRLKASKKPVTAKKILLPPLFMSTGFTMFFYPPMRVSVVEGLEAFVVGMLFSIFLIKTSTFEVKENEVFLKRSKAFVFILLGLLIIRLLLKSYVGQTVSLLQTSALFFILAFGMILPWRIAMYVMYRKHARLVEERKQSSSL